VVIHDDSPPGSCDVATTLDDGSTVATIASIASAGMISTEPLPTGEFDLDDMAVLT
jgi:hypothetical protein